MYAQISAGIIGSLRPRQWVKNAVVAAPLVFSGYVFYVPAVIATVCAIIAVSLVASAIYLLNDIRDREEDSLHPTKQNRPIASGLIRVELAYFTVLLCMGAGLALAALLGPLATLALLGFLLVNMLYTYWGKRVQILDVMLIGGSFVMRVCVGAAAILVPVSAWLVLTLFFLASYLGFTKRIAEQRLGVLGTRAVLAGYTPAFLDHARSATLAVTLALYTLYTFASPFGSLMALTVPCVFFGLLRYQAITDADTGANNGPTDNLYTDRQLQVVLVLWCLLVVGIIALHV